MVLEDRGGDLPNYNATLNRSIYNEDVSKGRSTSDLHKVATEKSESSAKRAVFAQCIVAGAGLINLIGCGMPIGYSAILLPQLSNSNSTIYIDKDLGSWIAAVHSLAVPTAGIFSALLLDTIGRRGCLQLAALPLFAGWIVMGFSTSVHYILAGRIILGFAVGLIAMPAQTLTMETANAKLRGMLSGSNLTAYTIGILMVYTLGAYFGWNIVAFSCTVIPIVAFIYLCLIPESPIWLVRQNRIEDAKKALLWLRGGDAIKVNNEIETLMIRAKHDEEQKSKTTSICNKLSDIASMITSKGVMKPLFIINIYTFLQQLSGTYLLIFYGVDIVKNVGGRHIETELASVITALVRFVSSFIACFLLYKIGRRPLSIISCAGTTIACFTLSGYLYFKKEDSPMDIYIVTISLLVYIAFNTIGLFPLPLIMLVELLPTRARAVIGGCTYSLFNFMLFGVTKAFPILDDKIGMTGIFLLFGVSSLLLIIFVYLVLPETKNYTLEEIEDYFQQNNLLWITRKEVKHPA